MRWVSIVFFATGCTVDSSGSVCSEPPPWFGSDGPSSCGGSSTSSQDDARYLTYSTRSAIPTAGGARVALNSWDGVAGRIEITRVDFATRSTSALVPLPGEGVLATLAGDDRGAYLTWQDDKRAFGGLLHADDTLGEVADFGDALTGGFSIVPFAVGDRFLLVQRTRSDQRARWVDRAGSVGEAFDFPGSFSPGELGPTAAGFGVVATMFQRGDAIYVARGDGTKVRVADDGFMRSLAALADGALLASYATRYAPATPSEVHVVRIEPDGTRSEHVVPFFERDIIVAGTRIFGVSMEEAADGEELDTYVAIELDEDSAPIGPARTVARTPRNSDVTLVGVDEALVLLSSYGSIDATLFDARTDPVEVVVAERYELDDGGGCNASHSLGVSVALSLVCLRRRRRVRGPHLRRDGAGDAGEARALM